MESDIGTLVDFGSGTAFVLLGLWILTLRPLRRPNAHFAVFLLAFGAFWMLVNTMPDGWQTRSIFGGWAMLAAGGVALVFVSLSAPHFAVGHETPRRHQLVLPTLTLLGYGIPFTLMNAVWAVAGDGPFLTAGFSTLLGWTVGVLAFAAVLAAVRYHRAGSTPERGRLAVFAAAAYLAYTVSMAEEVVLLLHDPYFDTWDAGRFAVVAPMLVALLVPVAVWAYNMHHAPDKRVSRIIFLLLIGLTLLGFFLAYREGNGPYGIVRLAGVLLLTVAILRGQFLDVDLKLHWSISRGSLAAIFVAVFFVVSEGAQEVFSSRLGPLWGILATGLLVFAVAPLQRISERIGNTLVPGGRPIARLTSPDRVRVYREQLQAAWRDGALSLDERNMLEQLRMTLGLSPEDVGQVETQWLRERDDR